MKLHDIEFYDEEGYLEGFTVVTCSPQTNSRWLAQDLVKRYNGALIELGVTKPNLVSRKDFTVVINTEMPILSGHVQADELFSMIRSLRESTKHLVLCITLSDALIDGYYDTGKQLARLATKALYESQLIIQLRPLETGRARDITGRFVIARGPCSSGHRSVVERELFYFVGSRGNVELNVKR